MVQIIQGSTTHTVVVDDSRTVTAVVRTPSSIAVRESDSVAAVVETLRVTNIAGIGVQGQPGRDGQDGELPPFIDGGNF